MNVGPRVATIICNYDYGPIVAEAINSVAEQLHRSIELWVIDDASNDDSRAVIEREVAHARRRFQDAYVVLQRTNLGKLGCLNQVVPRIAAPYMLVLDADDCLEPEFLSETLAALMTAGQQVGFAYTDCTLIDRGGARIGRGRSSPWDSELIHQLSFVPSCALTLTTAMKEALPFDETIRTGTKHHRWRRIAARGWTGLYLEKPLFRYRMHDRNASGIGSRVMRDLAAGGTSERLLSGYWSPAGCLPAPRICSRNRKTLSKPGTES